MFLQAIFLQPIKLPNRVLHSNSMANYSRTIKQQTTWIHLLYKLVDAASIGLGLIVLLTWAPEINSKATIIVALVALGIFSLAAEFMGLYRNWQAVAFERETTCCLIAWGATLMCLGLLGQVSQHATELSGRSLFLWFAVTPVFSLAGRVFIRLSLRWMVNKGIYTRSFAIIGVNQLGIRLVNKIENSPEQGLKFLGFFDDRPEERTEPLPENISKRLGDLTHLIEQAKSGGVNVVFVTLPMKAEERIKKLVSDLSDTTCSVYLVPDLFVFQLLHSRWTDIGGVPVVSVFENPFYGIDGMLKRSVDIVLASLALLFAALPMLLIGIAVKLTSRGPVLFKQKRYGLDGKQISVWKFRSMTVCEDGDNVVQATKNDSRFTSIGGFLRRSSLDELPQLVNVLSGSMSMIGPRPHATAHNEFYRSLIEGYMLRHKVKPGITGLAQVNGCRGETETLDKMERRIAYDHRYIREWSIWMDMKILLRTFTVVFGRQNAY